MSGFYTSSPWSGAGSAGEEIGNSLRRLTATMAQKSMMDRLQQQRMALMQQAQQQHSMLEQAQMGTQRAQAGFDDIRAGHQQAVDNAARGYQQAVVARSDGPGMMNDGPTIDGVNKMALSRELGTRALVRALGGNVDNPPTAMVGPGQERINTMTGDVLGYLPPNPSFHSVPAGGTPYIMNGDGQASPTGPQTGFRPNPVQGMRPGDISNMMGHLASIAATQAQFPAGTNAPTAFDKFDAGGLIPMLAQAFTNQLPARTTNSAPDTIASPKTQQEYDALPSGATYIDTDGATKRKK